MQAPQQQFSYFLNERRALLVVSLVGRLSAQDGEILERCSGDVKKSPAKYVILNLQGFTDYDPVLAGKIVRLQQLVREKPAFLTIAGLSAVVKEKMAAKGLIRESELVDSIQSALQVVLAIGLKGGG